MTRNKMVLIATEAAKEKKYLKEYNKHQIN